MDTLTGVLNLFLTQGTPVNNIFIHATPELHCSFLESTIILHYVNMHIFPPEIQHVTEALPSVSIITDLQLTTLHNVTRCELVDLLFLVKRVGVL